MIYEVRTNGQVERIRRKCAKHGLCWAKRFARNWVKAGQPGSVSSRNLCNILSSAVEKRREWMYENSYIESKYGPEIYSFMWS